VDEHNRALVDRLSGGRIGYVYLSDMYAVGMDQFVASSTRSSTSRR